MYGNPRATTTAEPRSAPSGTAWHATSGTRQRPLPAARAWLGQMHCGGAKMPFGMPIRYPIMRAAVVIMATATKARLIVVFITCFPFCSSHRLQVLGKSVQGHWGKPSCVRPA
jgi:hypothetical protein